MRPWIIDDCGDLVNLEHMEAIIMRVIEEEDSKPEGHTHELLAVNTHQETYRIASGTEESCKAIKDHFIKQLGIVTVTLIPCPNG